jgi:hypothetical protein
MDSFLLNSIDIVKTALEVVFIGLQVLHVSFKFSFILLDVLDPLITDLV